MARRSFVAGNWKMNLTKRPAVELATAVARENPRADVQVGVAPPFVYLDAVGEALAGTAVLLGAQDIYFEKNGAFTGEISCEMLADLNVRFVLTGHSERRHVLGEGGGLIARKAQAAYDAGFTVVHCVGEKIEQRDAGQTLAVVHGQLDELSTRIDDPDRLVIAYEPVWAIGTGRVATDDQAQQVHAYIRDAIEKRWNTDFAGRVRIQYGGSVKPDNAAGLLGRHDIDGALVGGASLQAESFLGIVAAAK